MIVNADAACLPYADKSASAPLKAPFPWFGGKSKPAPMIWERFGDVANYVDPFCGSLAVPLARPHRPRSEIFNDADGLLVNFWRACAWAPDETEEHARWPISELDLHARHRVLIETRDGLTERLRADPKYFDAELAGWWVWGQSVWLGKGWGWKAWTQVPVSCLRGINGDWHTLPVLRERLKQAVVLCGDWRRVITQSYLFPASMGRPIIGHTAVLLDPPYEAGNMAYAGGNDSPQDVAAWARENGENPRLRIALCGHEGDYDMPGWSTYRWKAQGGYGNHGKASDTRHRECIWFSPHCLEPRQGTLPFSP